MAITKGKNDDLRYELIGMLGGLDLKERWEPFLNNTLMYWVCLNFNTNSQLIKYSLESKKSNF